MNSKKKLILVACMIFPVLVSCASSKPLAGIYKNGGAYDLYSRMDSSVDKSLAIEAKRPPVSPSEYMRVYRGSYKDDNGNLVEGGWELIRLRKETPDANF